MTGPTTDARKPATPWPYPIWAWSLFAVALCVGMGLRLWRMVMLDGFEHDEALLALNFLDMGWLQVFAPLQADQAAPVGFVLLSRLAVGLLGQREWVMRLTPLLAGLASLPLMFVTARAYTGTRAAAVAVVLLAMGELAIRYACLFKQYSLDLCATLILLLIAAPLLLEQFTPRRLVRLVIAGCVLVWFSYPAVFIIAAIGLMAMAHEVHQVYRGHLRDTAATAAGMAVCAVSFLVPYLLVYRHYAGSAYLSEYWQEAFAPWPQTVGDLRWYSNAFFKLFESPGAFPFVGLAGALFVAGLVLLWRRQRSVAVMMVLPFALTLMASMVGRYPFAHRLMIFALPLLLIPMAAAVALPASEGAGPTLTVLRVVLASTLLLQSVYLATKYVARPRVEHDVKPALAYLQEHWHEGDTVYLHYGATMLTDYYLQERRLYDLPGATLIYGVYPEHGIESYQQDLASMRGRERAWVVFAMARRDAIGPITGLLDQMGRRIEHRKLKGADVLLYDLSSGGGESSQ